MSNTPPIDTGEEDPTLPSTSSTTDKAVDTPVTGIPDDRSTTAPSETTTTTTATTTEPDIQTGATSVDLLILPLTNEVCGSFSDDQPVYSKTMNDWRVHNGVDFVGSDGQAVKALADGTIQDLEEDPLLGQNHRHRPRIRHTVPVLRGHPFGKGRRHGQGGRYRRQPVRDSLRIPGRQPPASGRSPPTGN